MYQSLLLSKPTCTKTKNAYSESPTFQEHQQYCRNCAANPAIVYVGTGRAGEMFFRPAPSSWLPSKHKC